MRELGHMILGVFPGSFSPRPLLEAQGAERNTIFFSVFQLALKRNGGAGLLGGGEHMWPGGAEACEPRERHHSRVAPSL